MEAVRVIWLDEAIAEGLAEPSEHVTDEPRQCLVVDGEIVWVDGEMEPEDGRLCRDLGDFVAIIRRLVSKRDEALANADHRDFAAAQADAHAARAELERVTRPMRYSVALWEGEGEPLPLDLREFRRAAVTALAETRGILGLIPKRWLPQHKLLTDTWQVPRVGEFILGFDEQARAGFSYEVLAVHWMAPTLVGLLVRRDVVVPREEARTDEG